MTVDDFSYELAPQLIAQSPPRCRPDSRLLRLADYGDGTEDLRFGDIVSLFQDGDVLVLNDTRVVPARLQAKRDSGGRVEIMLERIIDDQRALVQAGPSRRLRPGQSLLLENGEKLSVEARNGRFFRIHCSRDIQAVFNELGQMPLPPYIHRVASDADTSRYQTVFARRPGAVAAPTAGLHYDPALLQEIHDKGVQILYLTLHIGAATFLPVTESDPRQHQMHAERIIVSDSVATAVNRARKLGGRIVAGGTTVVRALESATKNGQLMAVDQDTRLFIYPGYDFQIVDVMITNFHLPKSTLLMMVCAFGGRSRLLRAYHRAIELEYRFFSYGDAMWLPRRQTDDLQAGGE